MRAPSASEELQRIVEGAWGAVARNDWEALDEFFAHGYVRHTGASSLSLADFKHLLKAEHAAFPDTEIELHDFIAGGDRIAFRWASSATHLGTYLGVPPTHRRVSVSGITVSRIANGRIVEDWASWNKAELLKALGIVPIDALPEPSTQPLPDAAAVRAVHRQFATGVTIVTTVADGEAYGLVVNAFSSISLEPPLVLVCVGQVALTYAHLFADDRVAVNILARDQQEVAQTFARSGGDKFAGLSWHAGKNGAPVLDGCAARLEGVIETRIPAYTHTIFVIRVTDAETFDREPLLYLRGTFFDGGNLDPAP